MNELVKKNMSEEDQVKVSDIELEELVAQENSGASLNSTTIELVKNIKINLRAFLGSTKMDIESLFKLRDGDILKLESETSSDIVLELDGHVVAKGKLIVVDDCFGVKISEVIEQRK